MRRGEWAEVKGCGQGGDASSLQREGPVGQVVTEVFRRGVEQPWIVLDGKGARAMEGACHRNRTRLSPTSLQTTRRQGFGEPAAGCQAGDSAMWAFFLSNRIFFCFPEKSIVRTKSDGRYEKHFGNCKTLCQM